jgi:hypothetical protein
MAAGDAKSSGDFAKAIELYTEALKLAPSPLTFAHRADCLLKSAPPRPNAAIQDCNKALEANPDSGKALKMRGTAYRLLGQWENSAKDLAKAQSMDFDEGIQEMFTHVQKFNTKIQAKKNKLRQKEEMKAQKEKLRRMKAAAAARKVAQDEQDERDRKAAEGMPGGMGGMPGGMGGMPGGGGGGMPPGMADMFSDPEIMAAMQNPAVMEALGAAQSGDMSKLQEALKDPVVAKAFGKLQGAMGGKCRVSLCRPPFHSFVISFSNQAWAAWVVCQAWAAWAAWAAWVACRVAWVVCPAAAWVVCPVACPADSRAVLPRRPLISATTSINRRSRPLGPRQTQEARTKATCGAGLARAQLYMSRYVVAHSVFTIHQHIHLRTPDSPGSSYSAVSPEFRAENPPVFRVVINWFYTSFMPVLY